MVAGRCLYVDVMLVGYWGIGGYCAATIIEKRSLPLSLGLGDNAGLVACVRLDAVDTQNLRLTSDKWALYGRFRGGFNSRNQPPGGLG